MQGTSVVRKETGLLNKRIGFKHTLFLVLAAGMLVYAVPLLPVGKGETLPSVFAAVWIGFALLVIAVHLHRLLGVDRVKEAELAAVERLRRGQKRRLMYGGKV
jgi:putative Mn2+ efflux pump MntP